MPLILIFSLPLTVKAECVSLNQLLGLKTHTANRVDGLNLRIKQETDSIVLYRAASCMDT